MEELGVDPVFLRNERNTYRLTPAQRIEIIRLHQNGGPGGNISAIARRLGITREAVRRWIVRYYDERALKEHVGNGRPRTTTEEEDFLLACTGKKYDCVKIVSHY